MHGAYQVTGILLTPLREKIYKKINRSNPILCVVRWAGTFILVNFAWILFRANSLSDAIFIIKRILLVPFNAIFPLNFNTLGLSYKMLTVMLIFVSVLVVVDLINRKKPVAKWINSRIWTRYIAYFILLLAIFVFGYYGPEFDPQDFVYFQF